MLCDLQVVLCDGDLRRRAALGRCIATYARGFPYIHDGPAAALFLHFMPARSCCVDILRCFGRKEWPGLEESTSEEV